MRNDTDDLISRQPKRTETHACDLIDRRALMKEFSEFVKASNNSDFERTPTWNDAVSLVGSMPSIQPDSKESSFTHKALDLIERQAAIDVCNYAIDLWHGQLGEGILRAVKKRIEALPSAQPEIVRCNDCLMHGVCRFEQGLGLDGYCSQAERRSDG